MTDADSLSPLAGRLPDAPMTDKELLDDLEIYEFNVEYVGGDEGQEWRARYRYSWQGPQYVYGSSPRDVIPKAIAAYRESGHV